jgi:hypothetical protein
LSSGFLFATSARRAGRLQLEQDRDSDDGLTQLSEAARAAITNLRLVCHELPFFDVRAARLSSLIGAKFLMPKAKTRATAIIAEFDEAQAELVDRAVVLTDGKAGTVDHVWLDELHGLRISIRGHDGKWPISTIKFVQT